MVEKTNKQMPKLHVALTHDYTNAHGVFAQRAKFIQSHCIGDFA